MKKVYIVLGLCFVFIGFSFNKSEQDSKERLYKVLQQAADKINSTSEFNYDAVILERISSKGLEGQEMGKEQHIRFTVKENQTHKYIKADASKPRNATAIYDASKSTKSAKIGPLSISIYGKLLLAQGPTPIDMAGLKVMVGVLTREVKGREDDDAIKVTILQEDENIMKVRIVDEKFNPKGDKYTVKEGDFSIAQICLKLNVPIQTTLEVNNLSRLKQKEIEVGDTLLVPNTAFKELIVVFDKKKLLPLEVTVKDNESLPLAIYKHTFY